MAVMVATGDVSEDVAWREWGLLVDAARDAALTLLLASDDAVHEDYRPTCRQVAEAQTVIARWRKVSCRPLPELGPQYVSGAADWCA
jgi:hypothetical protein